MDFDDYKLIYSEVMMYYQIIEKDLKLIYSYIHIGDPVENYDRIKNKTLGQMIIDLKKLDNEDGKPDISLSDYNFLHQISKNRNMWAHSNFIDFMYEENPFESIAYLKQCKRLQKDHDRLQSVYKNLETLRINIFSS